MTITTGRLMPEGAITITLLVLTLAAREVTLRATALNMLHVEHSFNINIKFILT